MSKNPENFITQNTTTDISSKQVANLIDNILQQANRIILGKEHQLRLALACLMARGHLLIEDQPGMGKTTLAHMLAQVLGLEFQRLQFTSDLLPADIIGSSIYNRDSNHFTFHHGPIFTQLLLADEVNRATPKCQSALLEAMEERQVTVEGETYPLPLPFFVIATQNPLHQIGTFPLPESQLDRFLMRLTMGYPDHAAERELLIGHNRRELIPQIKPQLSGIQLLTIQTLVTKVHVAEPLLDYLQALLIFSRQTSEFMMGLSPRAGLAILRAAQAWALLHGRDHLLPEDIQTILPVVTGHRLQGRNEYSGQSPEGLAARLALVPIP